MKGKKFLIWILSCLCVGALSLGVACGESGTTNESGGESGQESSSMVDSSLMDSSIVDSSVESGIMEESSEVEVSSGEESSEEVVSSEESVESSEEIESSEEVIESSEEVESSEEHICTFGDWYVFTPADCETVGEERRDCESCDEYETREIPAQEHKYTELKYDDVQHWYECECGEVREESLEKHYGGTATTTEKAKCTLCGQEYGELAKPIRLPIPETYEKLSDGTINFGAYPQTKVTDSAITTALTLAAGALPTASNSQNWTSYKYYIENSNEMDFMWYQDVAYEDIKYRGVYFNSYRPVWRRESGDIENSNQDNNSYMIDTVYWFEWEVLNWTVLEEKDGAIFLLCNNTIDSQEYAASISAREIDGVTVYANNYAESNIRKWLNENFYETAFTTLQQEFILMTEVDNSVESTMPSTTIWNSGVNKYACENTNDKVFLLSEQDVTNANYGFSTDPFNNEERNNRIRKTSDYAQSQGISVGWVLRSPYFDRSDGARAIDEYAFSYGAVHVDATSLGIVPALRIKTKQM